MIDIVNYFKRDWKVYVMAHEGSPTGDEAYNARRRYYRAAERHLNKANKLSGASADRERRLAEIQFRHALDTYDPETTQKLSKPMQRLANEFGIDVQQQREQVQSVDEKKRAKTYEEIREIRTQAISEEESKKARVKNLKDVQTRREYEAQQLFSQQNIAHRILGGLVNIWRTDENRYTEGKNKGKINLGKILPSVFEHYKVNTMADLLEKIEQEVGEMLYGADQVEIYDVVKLTLQENHPKVA